MRISLIPSTFLLAGAIAMAPLHAQDSNGTPDVAKPEYVRAALAKMTPAEKEKAVLTATKRISDPGTDATTRVSLVRTLALLQSPESIPALRPLLNDATLADEARYALQRIASPAANAALLAALRESTDTRIQIGLIESLGTLREAAAIPTLKELLRNTKTTEAALRSLCAIGTVEAFAILRDATIAPTLAELHRDLLIDISAKLLESSKSGLNRKEVLAVLTRISQNTEDTEAGFTAWLLRFRFLDADAAAALTGADPVARRAAAIFFNGSRDIESGKVLEKALLNTKSNDVEIIAGALVNRNQTSAAPALRTRIQAEKDSSAKAGLVKALAQLGGPEDVKAFAQWAKNPAPIGDAAKEALRQVRGASIADAFTSLIVNTRTDKETRLLLLSIVIRRPLNQALKELVPLLNDADADIRIETMKTVDRLASKEHIELLEKTKGSLTDKDIATRLSDRITKLRRQ
ncbi:MAG: hypothetical protein LBD14_00420 [Puniceicoccales bacterium]|jgi:hypothetical protein|nr:hypothetical protein [Puniceicoccales bacterium]